MWNQLLPPLCQRTGPAAPLRTCKRWKEVDNYWSLDECRQFDGSHQIRHLKQSQGDLLHFTNSDSLRNTRAASTLRETETVAVTLEGSVERPVDEPTVAAVDKLASAEGPDAKLDAVKIRGLIVDLVSRELTPFVVLLQVEDQDVVRAVGLEFHCLEQVLDNRFSILCSFDCICNCVPNCYRVQRHIYTNRPLPGNCDHSSLLRSVDMSAATAGDSSTVGDRHEREICENKHSDGGRLCLGRHF
jgi:hypothetical protein